MAASPMFPLGKALVPGEALPLHVFEPRYRQLVVDLLNADGPAEFGVVLIERGWEVGGGDARSGVGTVARVLDVRALPEGRFALIAVGVRRIKVERWLPDDPYPRADIVEWPDELDESEPEGVALGASVHAVAGRLRALHELAARAGPAPEPLDLDRELDLDGLDPVLASYRLVALAPIGPADAHRALSAPGPRQRLAVLEASLDDIEAALRFRLGDS